jgi:hypothetical protein
MVWLGALSQKSKNSRFKLGKGFRVVSDQKIITTEKRKSRGATQSKDKNLVNAFRAVSDQKNYHHREKKESLGYT